MSYLTTQIARALRFNMAREGRRAADLAGLLKCSRSSAQRRMAGETPLTLEELDRVSTWLGMSIPDFLASGVMPARRVGAGEPSGLPGDSSVAGASR